MHNLRPDPYEDSNALRDVQRFRKDIYFGRHFRSKANERDIIVSHPEKGTREGGLTPVETDQIVREIRASELDVFDTRSIRVMMSPFLRTIQTAYLYCDVLGMKEDPVRCPDLRERWFGDFDGSSNAGEKYQKVWDLDFQDPTHKAYGVESVTEVRNRITRLVRELDEDEDPRDVIVLVGHGDGATILYSGVSKFNPAFHHKSLRYLRNGEIQPLEIGDESWFV